MIAKAASFGTDDKNKVVLVAEPSYTSGTHIWNGTTPNLNKRPATIKTTAVSNGRFVVAKAPDEDANSASESDPVSPYKSDIPYNKMPEAKAPRTKYFIAASAARTESFCIPIIE